MSGLTVQDGTLVVKNGTLGTGQGCCCQAQLPCVCGNDCTQTISITFVRGGISQTITAAPEEFNSAQAFDDSSFANIDLSSSCGNLGPSGECGWIVEVYFCGCDAIPGDPFGCDPFSATYQAFVPADNDGCPEVTDELTFGCIGGDCSATITGSIT